MLSWLLAFAMIRPLGPRGIEMNMDEATDRDSRAAVWIGRELWMYLNEPWELARPLDFVGDAHHVLTVEGVEPDVHDPKLLLRLAVPLTDRGTEYERLVVDQHAGEEPLIAQLESAGKIDDLTLFGIDEARVPDDVYGDWWRGGLGIRGSLRLPR